MVLRSLSPFLISETSFDRLLKWLTGPTVFILDTFSVIYFCFSSYSSSSVISKTTLSCYYWCYCSYWMAFYISAMTIFKAFCSFLTVAIRLLLCSISSLYLIFITSELCTLSEAYLSMFSHEATFSCIDSSQRATWSSTLSWVYFRAFLKSVMSLAMMFRRVLIIEDYATFKLLSLIWPSLYASEIWAVMGETYSRLIFLSITPPIATVCLRCLLYYCGFKELLLLLWAPAPRYYWICGAPRLRKLFFITFFYLYNL